MKYGAGRDDDVSSGNSHQDVVVDEGGAPMTLNSGAEASPESTLVKDIAAAGGGVPMPPNGGTVPSPLVGAPSETSTMPPAAKSRRVWLLPKPRR